jgi:hypothetical protein
VETFFGYKIRYTGREGLEAPDASDTTLKVLPKYNGNIAEVDWNFYLHIHFLLITLFVVMRFKRSFVFRRFLVVSLALI